MSTPLHLRDIKKSYGRREVLRGFSGTFAPGRIAALVGPNGAGKTTLLRIIAGLQHFDGGQVTSGRALYCGGFDAIPVRGRLDPLRRAVGLSAVEGGARKLSRLSRGELQTIALEIALDLAPEVLLLDEPWTALEPDARELLNERLRSIAAGRVVICSSHDLDEVARVADDVVFLRDGIAWWKEQSESQRRFERDDLVRLYRESKGA